VAISGKSLSVEIATHFRLTSLDKNVRNDDQLFLFATDFLAVP
jgi:hypothetical protein